MLKAVDPYLLRKSFRQLSETPYFDPNLERFINQYHNAIEHVIEDEDNRYDPEIINRFTREAWIVQTYVAGSNSREAPYEMLYCLSAALKEWSSKDCIITSGLMHERDFHFRGLDPWETVRTTITHFETDGFDPLLVFIALPKLYRSSPIFCIPLYHELGHFVDTTNKISQFALLKARLGPDAHPQIALNHFKEHFADLFAASYCGSSSTSILNAIAGGHGASQTHPATKDRLDLVDAFLSGAENQLVDLFQICLKELGLHQLSPRFEAPQISECFDDVRPYQIASEAELHGIFPAGWKYLEEAISTRNPPWIKPEMGIETIVKTVNDLTEKSIRNMSTFEKWNDVTTP